MRKLQNVEQATVVDLAIFYGNEPDRHRSYIIPMMLGSVNVSEICDIAITAAKRVFVDKDCLPPTRFVVLSVSRIENTEVVVLEPQEFGIAKPGKIK